MNPLYIESTNFTPGVVFTSQGKLTIYGKSLPEDTVRFYQPLIQWINECTLPKIEFDIKLGSMNKGSSQQISKLLLLAKDNPKIKNYLVNWYYKIEDEEGLDIGKELEYLTDFQFNFFEFSAISA